MSVNCLLCVRVFPRHQSPCTYLSESKTSSRILPCAASTASGLKAIVGAWEADAVGAAYIFERPGPGPGPKSSCKRLPRGRALAGWSQAVRYEPTGNSTEGDMHLDLHSCQYSHKLLLHDFGVMVASIIDLHPVQGSAAWWRCASAVLVQLE